VVVALTEKVRAFFLLVSADLKMILCKKKNPGHC
jgi:hypothetical protein